MQVYKVLIVFKDKSKIDNLYFSSFNNILEYLSYIDDKVIRDFKVKLIWER